MTRLPSRILFILLASGSSAAELPPKVAEVTEVVHAFAKAVTANDLEAYRDLLESRDRADAAKNMERWQRVPPLFAALADEPMFVLVTDSIAEWHSKPWRMGLLKVPDIGEPDALAVSKVYLHRELPNGQFDSEGGPWTRGLSTARRPLLRVMRRYGLYQVLDRSFIPALQRCVDDPDPEVRKLALPFLKAVQTQDKRSNPSALEWYLNLAGD